VLINLLDRTISVSAGEASLSFAGCYARSMVIEAGSSIRESYFSTPADPGLVDPPVVSRISSFGTSSSKGLVSVRCISFPHVKQLSDVRTNSLFFFPCACAVEVKGPGDTLSSTQKVWIDVMLSAGIEVEVSPLSRLLSSCCTISDPDVFTLLQVCKVVEDDPPKVSKSRSATPAKRSRSGSAVSRRSKSTSTARDDAGDSDEYEEEEKPAPKRLKKAASAKPVKKEAEDEEEDDDEIICID
jgi:hypothetical protein